MYLCFCKLLQYRRENRAKTPRINNQLMRSSWVFEPRGKLLYLMSPFPWNPITLLWVGHIPQNEGVWLRDEHTADGWCGWHIRRGQAPTTKFDKEHKKDVKQPFQAGLARWAESDFPAKIFQFEDSKGPARGEPFWPRRHGDWSCFLWILPQVPQGHCWKTFWLPEILQWWCAQPSGTQWDIQNRFIGAIYTFQWSVFVLGEWR